MRAAAAVLIAASLACSGPRTIAPPVPRTAPDAAQVGRIVSQQDAPVARIVSQHCVRCHDGKGDSTLDLRQLPGESDTKTWLRMLEMVEGYRMPPPAHDGPVEKRFPLPAEQRDAFLESVTRMLGPAADPILYVRHLTFDAWLAIVTDVAAQALPAEGVQAAIDEAMGAIKPVGFLEARGRVTPADRVVVENVGWAVCRAIAKAESARPTAGRRLMVGLPAAKARAAPAETTRPIVETLHRAVYQAAPTADDVSDGQRLLAAVRGASASWPEAWVGLCTAYLTSPRVLHLYSGAP